MGDRGSFSYYGPGRASPFSSSFQDAPLRNLSGHFEYVGDDYDLSTRSPAKPDYADVDDNDPDAPDRIHCRYLANNFPVDFPAYSVNEEKTKVEDLRWKVADRLKVDPRKVRLIYKGRDLRHNRNSLKKYKMKQNSEVSVVITDRLNDYYGDSNSESGSDRDANNYLGANNRRQRPRAHSTIRFRSDENIPIVEPGPGGSYLSPNGHIPSISSDRHHRDSLRSDQVYSSRDDRHRGREREPSREPLRRQREPSPAPRRAPSPAPRRAHSPAPPPKQSPPPPAAPPADPNSPLGRVQALASVFRTQWLPSATRFLLSPPSDPTLREKEFLRLSESIMAKVVLAADNIETEGNPDARNERKAMINEAQTVLKKLDAVRKP